MKKNKKNKSAGLEDILDCLKKTKSSILVRLGGYNMSCKSVKFLVYILLLSSVFTINNISAYPPRDHTSWCYWCGGDGFINYGDPPTVYGTKAYNAYIKRYYPTGISKYENNPDFFPTTNRTFVNKEVRCRFEFCASNSKGSNYIKYSSAAIVSPINCYDCHNLSRAKVARGSKAINKKFTPPTGTNGELDINKVKCDICHNYKRYEGSAVSYDTVTYWYKVWNLIKGSTSEEDRQILDLSTPEYIDHPYAVSLHPFRVIDDKSSKISYSGVSDPSYIDRQATMQCSFCHDKKQASLPYHVNYKSRFRLAAGNDGPDTTGASNIYVDPAKLSTWLDTSRPVNTSAPVGTIEDDNDANVPDYFKRRNKRTKAFYSNNFCLQCHDTKGHTSNRNKTSGDTTRFAADIASTWNQETGGHVIRQKGTYLKPDDRMPCTVCHDPHSSSNNPFLLRDSYFNNDIVGYGILVPRKFCMACHLPPEFVGSKYPMSFFKSKAIYRYNSQTKAYESFDTVFGLDGKLIGVDPILDGIVLPIAPSVVDRQAKMKTGKKTYSPRIVNDHSVTSSRTCIGAYDFNRDSYFVAERYGTKIITREQVQDEKTGQNGCHSTAHNPKRLTCEGCHVPEFDWSFYDRAGRPRFRRKEKLKAGLWKNFIRHPVYVSIHDKDDNHIDVDDEVKNWWFDSAKQYELKVFFERPIAQGGVGMAQVATGKTWQNYMLGKVYNPPEMDGASKDVIVCLSCHNDHYISNKDENGVTFVSPDSTQAYMRMDTPYICMCCHPKGLIYDSTKPVGQRIVAAQNRHGGFINGKDSNATGDCNTCHSMHGRHPLDSTRAVLLSYGMYRTDFVVDEKPFDKNPQDGKQDTTYDGQRVYIDIRGRIYSKHLHEVDTTFNKPYAHLLHNRNQVITCGRCHGQEPGVDMWAILGKPSDTTGASGFRWPPNVYYPEPGAPGRLTSGNYDREDSYLTTKVWRQFVGTNFAPVRRSNRIKNSERGSEHDVDVNDDQNLLSNVIPGGSGYNVHLRCGYCHDPHGSDSYVQLRERIPLTFSSQDKNSTTWVYNGNVLGGDSSTPYPMKTIADNKREVPPGDYRKYTYTSGIGDFCTSCHLTLDDEAIEWHKSSDDYDKRRMRSVSIPNEPNPVYIGNDFTRHPTNISMRVLLNNIKFRKGDTTGLLQTLYKNWDTLVMQDKCAKNMNPVDSTLYDSRSKNSLGDIICLTCHNAHASDKKMLRKSYDFGVNSCVNICHPYVKTRNAGVY